MERITFGHYLLTVFAYILDRLKCTYSVAATRVTFQLLFFASVAHSYRSVSYYYIVTRYSYSYSSVFTDAHADPRQCTPDTPGVCHKHATCRQVTPHVCACKPASSYRCECNHGYSGDGLHCKGDHRLFCLGLPILENEQYCNNAFSATAS